MNSPAEPFLDTMTKMVDTDHSKAIVLLNLKLQELVLTNVDEDDFTEEVFCITAILTAMIRHIHASDMKAAIAETVKVHGLFIEYFENDMNIDQLTDKFHKIVEEE